MVSKSDGFDSCSQPFGRLLASFDSAAVNLNANLNGPLHWLLNRTMESDQMEFDINKVDQNSWEVFAESAARSSLIALAEPNSRQNQNFY